MRDPVVLGPWWVPLVCVNPGYDRGPRDNRNISIPDSASKGRYEGLPEILFCGLCGVLWALCGWLSKLWSPFGSPKF